MEQIVDRDPGAVLMRGGTFVVKTCEICGKQFQVLAGRAKDYKTCSKACTNLLKSRSQGGRIERKCQAEGCDNTFTITKSELDKGRGLYCSNDCRIKGLANKPRARTVGLFSIHVHKNGQLRAFVWENGVRRAVFLHRWQAEQQLGRRLHSDEKVVFLNGNENNTDWHNLAVYAQDGTLIKTGTVGYAPQTFKEYLDAGIEITHAVSAS